MGNKKILILIVVLVVVAAGAYIASRTIKLKKSGPVAAVQTKTPVQNKPEVPAKVDPMKVEKKDVPTNQVPDNFPLDIPIEKGAKITQNYNSTAENGLYQATRAFVTVKSLDENFKLYSDYLSQNGWKLISSLNQDNLKVLAATKGKSNLQITMSLNTANQSRTIEVSYSEQR